MGRGLEPDPLGSASLTEPDRQPRPEPDRHPRPSDLDPWPRSVLIFIDINPVNFLTYLNSESFQFKCMVIRWEAAIKRIYSKLESAIRICELPAQKRVPV